MIIKEVAKWSIEELKVEEMFWLNLIEILEKDKGQLTNGYYKRTKETYQLYQLILSDLIKLKEDKLLKDCT